MARLQRFLLALAVVGLATASYAMLPSSPCLQPLCSPTSATLPTPTSTTATLFDKATAYHWLALGDMGADSPFQHDMAKVMLTLYEKQAYHTIWLLGDLIYPKGEATTQGEAKFSKPYAPLLSRGVHFVAALGNHDVITQNGEQVLAFFKMPARYYTQVTALPNSTATLQVWVTDTNTLEHGDQAQLAWLNTSLGASTATWKMVIGHHPIVSSGAHGSSKGMTKHLLPLLQAHNVDAYLAGHDHHYERLHLPAQALAQPPHTLLAWVAGGGGAYLRPVGKLTPYTQKAISQHHVLALWLTPTQLQVEAVDKHANVFDCVRLSKSPSAVVGNPPTLSGC